MLQPKLRKVEAIKDFWLRLEYENGEVRFFDVTPYISGAWYGELNDKNYFNSIGLASNGYGVAWANGQDISPHELYENSVCIPNTTTIEAMQEVEEMMRHPEKYKTYDSVHEVFSDLLK